MLYPLKANFRITCTAGKKPPIETSSSSRMAVAVIANNKFNRWSMTSSALLISRFNSNNELFKERPPILERRPQWLELAVKIFFVTRRMSAFHLKRSGMRLKLRFQKCPVRWIYRQRLLWKAVKIVPLRRTTTTSKLFHQHFPDTEMNRD